MWGEHKRGNWGGSIGVMPVAAMGSRVIGKGQAESVETPLVGEVIDKLNADALLTNFDAGTDGVQ